VVNIEQDQTRVSSRAEASKAALYPLYRGSSEAWYASIVEGILLYSMHFRYPSTQPIAHIKTVSEILEVRCKLFLAT
jgi:hypothetical protein